ncbi:hypothetical protein [Pseudomonas baetica]|nr:hypothetical protein [Pseudomonas baetica]
MDNVKQRSGWKWFKWLAAATLVPVLGIPATKLAESYYDVSLFSSMFVAVGVWLSQTIPVHLWLFWVVTIVSTLLGAFGVWSFLDRRHQVGLAKAEQEKAFARAREAIAKLKTANSELDAAKLALGVARTELDSAGIELDAANTKIAELQNPALPPMTEDQDKVIAVIATYDSEGKECSASEFPSRIGLNLLEADGAMDVLEARKLIEFQYYNGRRYVTLTAKGRAYVLHADFWMPPMPS